MILTRPQRVALLKVYRRPADDNWQATTTYRQFRRLVTPGPGCIMVPWIGMWLGIEPDGCCWLSGYCHCACRDCFDIAITSTEKLEFCWACEEAGCETDAECQRDDDIDLGV